MTKRNSPERKQELTANKWLDGWGKPDTRAIIDDKLVSNINGRVKNYPIEDEKIVTDKNLYMRGIENDNGKNYKG